MNSQLQVDELHELDEGSWAYLSLWNADRRTESNLHKRVVEACESSGWPAVSWSSSPHRGNVTDSARFFEGMSHAVEHADVVVALLDSPSAMTDAELVFALSHNRPVVGLRLESEGTGGSVVQAMLQSYDRARLIDCADIDDCAARLRDVLADPGFAATIREAAGERVHHA